MTNFISSVWAKIDSEIAYLHSTGKTSTEKMATSDYDGLLPLLLSAAEAKFLPALDIIDPNKQILIDLAQYLTSGDKDHLYGIVEILKTGLIGAFGSKIDQLLREKSKDVGTSANDGSNGA